MFLLNYKSNLTKALAGIVQRYNPKKYWKMREYVIAPEAAKCVTSLKRCGIYIG